MDKKELVEKVAANLNMSRKDAAVVINETFNVISQELLKQEKVKLYNVGTLFHKKLKSKSITSPIFGGNVVSVPERVSIGFKASPNLVKELNNEK